MTTRPSPAPTSPARGSIWPPIQPEREMSPTAATPYLTVGTVQNMYGYHGVATPVSGSATARRQLKALQETADMLCKVAALNDAEAAR